MSNTRFAQMDIQALVEKTNRDMAHNIANAKRVNDRQRQRDVMAAGGEGFLPFTEADIVRMV